MDNTRFTVSYYGLKSDMEAFYKVYAAKYTFQIPLSAFLSLLVVFTTNDFKDFFMLTKDQVKVVFYMVFLIVTVWLVYSIIRLAKMKTRTIDKFCKEMMEKHIKENFEATCLFLVKKYDPQEKTFKLLCFEHSKSNSYYLPYVLYDRDKTIPEQLGDILKLISYTLCIPDDLLNINYLSKYDMWYQRFSERKNCIVTYDNKVFSLIITENNSTIERKCDFVALGRKYSWISFEEFKDHTVTSQNNREVIKLLEKNNLYLYVPFSFNESSSGCDALGVEQ